MNTPQTTLKNLAKEIYLKDPLSDEVKSNFLSQLESHTAVDHRENGWYCVHCREFRQREMAFPQKDQVTFPRVNSELWIVNMHYDGCRGWD